MKGPLNNIVSKLTFWKGEVDVTSPASYGSTEPPGQKTAAAHGVESGKEEPSREKWKSPTEFLLSCVAMSVGLGNIWRFPFVAYENGGGAFLIPYIIVLVFIGKPLYYMELCLGQFASFGSVKVWELAPAFRGVGYGQMIATWAVVTYYVSLMGITVYYFFASFSTVLPWAQCGNWSTSRCVDDHVHGNKSIVTNVTYGPRSPSDEYFNTKVLHINPDGFDSGFDAPGWELALCLLFSWIVLFVVLVKGVASSGKAAYFTALFPYLVLFVLLIKGATLPGAYDGVMFFIRPNWSKLVQLDVWYAAVSQSFFSLSVGFGSITMFGSYNDFRHNVYRDALIISITDTLTSLLAGFTIFSILGHLADQLGVPVDHVINDGGTSLAFVSYPDVLARFAGAPQFFSVMFFLMLFTLGVGSASALTGCVITIICDQFPSWKKPVVTLVVCITGFAMGLFYTTPQGQYLLTLVDHYGGGFIIFILAAFEVIAVHWVYGLSNFCRDIDFMLERKTGLYWRFCWACLIPVTLIVIFVYKIVAGEPLKHGSYVFGTGATAFGICLTVLAIGMLPLFFGVGFATFLREGCTPMEAFKAMFRPTAEWCPKDPEMRQKYRELLSAKDKETELQAFDNPVQMPKDNE